MIRSLLFKWFYRHTAIVLSGFVILGISLALWNMHELSHRLIQRQVRQNIQLYVEAIQTSRTLYSEVLDDAQLIDGVTATNDSLNRVTIEGHGHLPLPATFIMDLGQRLQLANGQTQVRLYSPFPFKGRSGMRGIQDEFEQRAWDALSQHPNQFFEEMVSTKMGQEYRYAVADVMKPSCVECHNRHPDNARSDWQVGDVRGVLKVVYPIEGVRQEVWNALRTTFGVLVGLSLMAITGVVLVISRLRQTSNELEKRVIERTAALDQTNQSLVLEQQKSQRLLLNILPSQIAEELKQGQSNIAKSHDQATILFADLVGFTELSAKMPAIELVSLLNQIFSQFDRLAEFYGLEKIKTIGDAYMVVGGLPIPDKNHAVAIAEMALAMRECIAQFQGPAGKQLELRIGINTGEVVAGVIGQKKFIYDLWGDTVNVASRMESSGLPGEIQLAEPSYNYLKTRYIIQSRGLVKIKGKGQMQTYWLLGKKTKGAKRIRPEAG